VVKYNQVEGRKEKEARKWEKQERAFVGDTGRSGDAETKWSRVGLRDAHAGNQKTTAYIISKDTVNKFAFEIGPVYKLRVPWREI